MKKSAYINPAANGWIVGINIEDPDATVYRSGVSHVFANLEVALDFIANELTTKE